MHKVVNGSKEVTLVAPRYKILYISSSLRYLTLKACTVTKSSNVFFAFSKAKASPRGAKGMGDRFSLKQFIGDYCFFVVVISKKLLML